MNLSGTEVVHVDNDTQRFEVSVRSGGPLRVVPELVSMRVEGHDGQRDARGEVGPIEVVDPRGTLAGWVLRARIQPGNSGRCVRIKVIPMQPVVVSGRADEVVTGNPVSLGCGEAAVLLSAPKGGGGGTFLSGARVVTPHAHKLGDSRPVLLLSAS